MADDVVEAAADTQQMNMIQAINSALDVMMDRDSDVVVMGEDVGYFGGEFRATAGLRGKDALAFKPVFFFAHQGRG